MSRNRAVSGGDCQASSEIGTLPDTVFAALQEYDLFDIQVEHVSLDSAAVKVHADGIGW